MTAPDRAAMLAAWEKVIAVLKADESLPLPRFDSLMYGPQVRFIVAGPGAAAEMAALEEALPCEFTARVEEQAGNPRYVLAGEIGGVRVQVDAVASAVAERKVTGVTAVEQVEWVRKPAPDSEGEA